MQVCLNSAKVRLNSGILERRHSNWPKALGHFRAARQIDETYCEPSYWIGATLLQQGTHIKQALQVKSVYAPCYVATTALCTRIGGARLIYALSKGVEGHHLQHKLVNYSDAKSVLQHHACLTSAQCCQNAVSLSSYTWALFSTLKGWREQCCLTNNLASLPRSTPMST